MLLQFLGLIISDGLFAFRLLSYHRPQNIPSGLLTLEVQWGFSPYLGYRINGYKVSGSVLWFHHFSFTLFRKRTDYWKHESTHSILNNLEMKVEGDQDD